VERARCRRDHRRCRRAALVTFQAWEEWVNAALAAWLIVSPYLLGFSGLTSAFWNQLIWVCWAARSPSGLR
jgi:hypothetical protein